MSTTANRIRQAIAETHALLAAELAYAPDMQKADMIAFYRRHIANLTARLATSA